MQRLTRSTVIALLSGLLLPGVRSALAQNPGPAPGDMVRLGKVIFFDTDLSANRTQSCASCHAPAVGFTGPSSTVNADTAIYPGALAGRFGNRKPPAAAYAGDSPQLHYVSTTGQWVGGMFWDGRATGETLGDPLAEQALGPFLNPLEQAMPDARAVCMGVSNAAYANLFLQIWGEGSLDYVNDLQGTYNRIGRSIAAYERSPEVNSFSSKFDLFWDSATSAGKDVAAIKYSPSGDPHYWQAYRNLGLTDTELQGLAIFNDPGRANCSSCHSLAPGPAGYPLFTDFSYHNLGVPKNPANPFYAMPAPWNPDGQNWLDYGLGGFLKSAGYAPQDYQPQMGKFKVPTLRNVDLRSSTGLVKAYTHNGYFKSLADVISFYHWRGMGGGMGGGGMGGMFPPPEVSENLATLNMIPMMDRSKLVAFLTTLSDSSISEPAIPGTPADFDANGYVNGDDLDAFRSCAGGPATPYADNCMLPLDASGMVAADFDKDLDVDQEDFGILQRCLSGSTLANADCAR